ncbi:metaxin-1 [Dermacentor variabilis]|uniref:metaxin-1 n=1 Tax=Dermacentor variabilis TaxID=34621 RepID=UPI003F5BCA19
MEVYIWKGDWGLPSIDTACLEVMAYAKFSGAPLKTREVRRPWFGSLPVMRHGPETKLTKFQDVVAYLRKQNYSADVQMTPQQASDAKAYIAMLRQKLKPALLYQWWVDAQNFVELTRPWYAKALGFPFNYIIPGQMQRAATAVLNSKLQGFDLEGDQAQIALFKEAQECMTTLSQRLGKEPFFFGQSPTSLDAIVFAHLAPLLRAPFPSCALQNHLKACDNLAAFVTRIMQRYFSVKDTGSGDSAAAKVSTEEFSFSWLNSLISVGVATVAMLSYALLSGLVQVEYTEEEPPPMDSRDKATKRASD